MNIQNLKLAAAASALCIATAPAFAQSPYQADEGDWVSVTGTVNAVEEDSFTLDYGTNNIEVEFDSLISTVDADEKLNSGNKVTVYGYADDDWFEGRVIDAEQVYIEDRSTFYGVNDVPGYVISYAQPYARTSLDGTFVSLEGTVDNIDGRNFDLTSGDAEITIDTSSMTYNPLDDRGVQQLKDGDRIAVWGNLEDTLFSDLSLTAERIYTLRNTEDMNSGMQTSENRRKTSDQKKYTSAEDNSRQAKSDSSRADASQMEQNKSSSKNQMTEFAMIDANSNGVISEKEWVRYVSKPKNISKAAARQMFDAVARGDDRLTRSEFISPSEQVDRMFKQIREEDS